MNVRLGAFHSRAVTLTLLRHIKDEYNIRSEEMMVHTSAGD